MGAADVELHQPDRPANGAVGLPAGTVGARTAVEAEVVANWPVDDDQRGAGMSSGLDGVEVEHRVAHGLHCSYNHRQVLGTAPGHHRIHGQLLHRGRAPNGRNLADDVLGTQRSRGQHGSYTLGSGRDDRQAVGPTSFKIKFLYCLKIIVNFQVFGD